MSEQKIPTSGSLARKLAIWVGGFFFLAAVLLLAWTTWLQRKESLAELKNLARTNAAFVGNLGFPLSPQLASQLSSILDLGVGFYSDKLSVGNLPPELLRSIQEMSRLEAATSRRHSGIEVALAPLPAGKGGGFLVLIRERSVTTTIFAPSFYLPAIVLAFGCAGLAFGLGRSIVQPLQALTRWLPNLKAEHPSQTELIPEAISKRNDEVGILSRSLLETRNQLAEEKELRIRSERLAALGRVATSLAHEVKNPAAAIRMHADLLAAVGRKEDAESVDLIREEVDQISDIVNQWLFVAKSKPSKTGRHDLHAIVSKVGQRMQAGLEHAGVHLQIDQAGKSLFVNVDALRMEQVIRNLIQNAAQAMPRGGKICASLRPTGENAELIIKDEGDGFSDKALLHFGEPFFSEREGGMGIGLTLSTEVVKAHGGSISPKNHENGGGTVTLQLPLFNASPHE